MNRSYSTFIPLYYILQFNTIGYGKQTWNAHMSDLYSFKTFKQIYIHSSCIIITHCILLSNNLTMLQFQINLQSATKTLIFLQKKLFIVLVLEVKLLHNCKSIAIIYIKSNCNCLFIYWQNLKTHCLYSYITFYNLNECILNHHS